MTFDMKESSQTWWLWMGRSHTKQLVFPSVCSIFELLGSLTLLSGGPPSQEGPELKVLFYLFQAFKLFRFWSAVSSKKAFFFLCSAAPDVSSNLFEPSLDN